MSDQLYEDINRHVGHDIECVTYGHGANAAIECVTCGEVIVDKDDYDPRRGSDQTTEGIGGRR